MSTQKLESVTLYVENSVKITPQQSKEVALMNKSNSNAALTSVVPNHICWELWELYF